MLIIMFQIGTKVRIRDIRSTFVSFRYLVRERLFYATPLGLESIHLVSRTSEGQLVFISASSAKARAHRQNYLSGGGNSSKYNT
jgi:hypothetical protein